MRVQKRCLGQRKTARVTFSDETSPCVVQGSGSHTSVVGLPGGAGVRLSHVEGRKEQGGSQGLQQKLLHPHALGQMGVFSLNLGVSGFIPDTLHKKLPGFQGCVSLTEAPNNFCH